MEIEAASPGRQGRIILGPVILKLPYLELGLKSSAFQLPTQVLIKSQEKVISREKISEIQENLRSAPRAP